MDTQTEAAGLSEGAFTLGPTKPQIEQTTQQQAASGAEKSPVQHCPLLTPWQLLVIAASSALFAGNVESFTILVQRSLLGMFQHMSSQVMWVGTTLNLVVAFGLTLPLALGIRCRVIKMREDTGTLLFVFCAMWSMASLVPGLHLIAKILLAAGATVQLTRWVQANHGTLTKVATYFLPLGALLFGAFAICIGGRNYFSSNHSLPITTAGQTAAPNIVLVVMDTVRADAIDFDGSRTPNLKRLAEEGFVFDEARSTSPWTLPSHASMFTGKLPSELSVGWSNPLAEERTIAHRLQAAGYQTAGFVANRWYCSTETGLDFGFEHFDDYDFSWANWIRSTAWSRQLVQSANRWVDFVDDPTRRSAADISGRFVAWVGQAQQSKSPFFATLNYFDAHDPYIVPTHDSLTQQAKEKKRALREWWLSDKEDLSEESAQFQYEQYLQCVTYLDQELGKLFEHIDGIENTVLIVTSDHGEHFGDHDLYGHGNSLYDASIHVPLIVWSNAHNTSNTNSANNTHSAHSAQVSSLPSGASSSQAVSLLDLPATIENLAGIESSFPGRSWTQYFEPDSAVPVPVRCEIDLPSKWPPCAGRSPVFRGAMQSVVLGKYKYIHNADGSEELFDLSADAAEETNVIAQTPQMEVDRLRALLNRDEE